MSELPGPAPPAHGSRLHRRALMLTTAAYVLGWSAHTTFVFYLAPVALRLADLGGRDAWVFAGTAVASILTVLPAGRLADTVPRRRVLRAGLVLLALSYVPLLLPLSFIGVLVATLFTGSGLAFVFVSFHSYMADLLASGQGLGRAYGSSHALAVVAGAAGPFGAALVFGALGEAAGLRVNALLFLVAALGGAALTLALPKMGHVAPDAHLPGGVAALARAWRRDKAAVGPVALIHGTVGVAYGMTTPYFAVFFLDVLRSGTGTWGLILAAATLASALGSAAAGRLGERHAARPVLLGAQAVMLAASLVFLAPLPLVLLAGAFVARNAMAMTVAPIVGPMLMARVKAADRGSAQGFVTLAWNVGWAFGATAGGLLLARLGGALFPLGAVIAFVGVAWGIHLLARAPAERWEG